MKTVNYISHMLEENVEDIKALALYFDQINIIEQRHIHILAPERNAKIVKKNGKAYIESKVVSTNDFTEENFLLHLKDFEKNKVIKYLMDADSGGSSLQPGVQSISSDMQINDLVLYHTELVGKKHNEKQYTDGEGRVILSYDLELNKEATHLTEKLFNDTDNTNKLLSYYARVFKTFVNYYEEGKDVLTTSKYVNDLFKEISKTDRFKETQKAFKNEFNVTPSFALEAIKLGLPNLGKFPSEEILRFKENSKDELLEFQTKLELLTFDLLNQYDFNYINTNAQKIADIKIRPLIENIRSSLDNSKFKVIQELIKEAKDPRSYSPLLLTFSDKISSSLILLISAGLVSLNVGLEHYSRIKKAKKDGIYYLYKMQKYFT
jgi:hypothetical protein